jgi:hypothetical protein
MVESELVGATPEPSLADAIRLEIQEANAAATSAVEHARRAGELLIEAKGACAHGEWNRWLEANVGVSDRTVRLYMQLARHWNRLSQPERQRVADLRLGQVIQEMRGLLTDAGSATATSKAPPVDARAQRVERERKRALDFARESRQSLQQLMDYLVRLPLPDSVEDFKSWSGVLMEMGSTAETAGRELETWHMRIESPQIEGNDGTVLTVKLAPAGEDLADITSQELFDVMEIYRKNEDHVAWCYQSESEDIGIMKLEEWWIEPEPPSQDYYRWEISIERPGEAPWIRGFWSPWGRQTHAISGENGSEGGRKPRSGWTSWGPP